MPDGKSISIQPFDTQGIRKISFYDTEPLEEYDMICVPVSQEQVDAIEMFFQDTQADGYDWPGMLLSKLTPFFVKRTGRWYCSEWIAYALRLSGAVASLYHYNDLTPQRLYEILRAVASGNNLRCFGVPKVHAFKVFVGIMMDRLDPIDPFDNGSTGPDQLYMANM